MRRPTLAICIPPREEVTPSVSLSPSPSPPPTPASQDYGLPVSPPTTRPASPTPAPSISTTLPTYQEYKAPRATTHLLFAPLSQRDVITLLVPACAVSLLLGGSAPFMTEVIGVAFDAFAAYPVSGGTAADGQTLLFNVGITSAELGGLAILVVVVSCVGSSLWVRVGERVLRVMRERVFVSVLGRDMEWFDRQVANGENNAGGLQKQFVSDTDAIRVAICTRTPQLIEHITTTIIALVLAFSRSPLLSLIILSVLPIFAVLEHFIYRLSRSNDERMQQYTSRVSSFLHSSLQYIATVKAFNAHLPTYTHLHSVLRLAQKADDRLSLAYATRQGMLRFIMNGAFVSAFWFGAHLVLTDALSPGAVMSVFWACLIASSNASMIMEPMREYVSGKEAMKRLCIVVDPPPFEADGDEQNQSEDHSDEADDERAEVQTLPAYESPSIEDDIGTLQRAGSPTPGGRRPSLPRSIIKLPLTPKLARAFSSSTFFTSSSRPSLAPTVATETTVGQVRRKKRGAIDISHLTFSYPLRRNQPALSDVSIFFPAGELTFVVGGSGSGKSTLASLLVGMYTAHREPGMGCITYDGVPEADARVWRERTALVQSGGGVVFDMSVRENVVIAAEDPDEVDEAVVRAALEMSMLGAFVSGLEGGLDARLGEGGKGTVLSGGQMQRLALARARVRDPEVLILDEATSALDPASRLKVFAALMEWRKNKTTIVITHDLSQLSPSSFTYVLKDGKVVEQGFRRDLELIEGGEFSRMCQEQARGLGGAIVSNGGVEDEPFEAEKESRVQKWRKHATVHVEAFKHAVAEMLHRHSLDGDEKQGSDGEYGPASRRSKFLSFIPRPKHATSTSPAPNPYPSPDPSPRESPAHFFAPHLSIATSTDGHSTQESVEHIRQSGEEVVRKRSMQRSLTPNGRRQWIAQDKVVIEMEKEVVGEAKRTSTPEEPESESVSLFEAIRKLWRTVPHKWSFVLGMLISVANGAATPLFSFFLARLLAQVALGPQAMDFQAVTILAATVLAITFGDGLTMFLKIAIVELIGHSWVTKLRAAIIWLLITQDKTFHDDPANTPEKLGPTLWSDVQNTAHLVSQIAPEVVSAATMLGGAMVWALIIGWKFTLVGFALVPLFVTTASGQMALTAKAEEVGHRARMTIADRYSKAIGNIRAIRGLGLDATFQRHFVITLDKAVRAGITNAWIMGCAFGLTNALIYISEATLFIVGAKLVSLGQYTYESMVQVLTLVVFSLVYGGQAMAVTADLAKALQGASVVIKLLDLAKIVSSESKGLEAVKTDGVIRFDNVSFTYRHRPENQVLKHLNLTIYPGESVAIVGASGCGKSTIASLLQRLYEPTIGSIWLDKIPLSHADVNQLRKRIAVVSQQAAVFDTSVLENITYGAFDIPFEQAVAAARAAQIHDFIMSLPQGYHEPIGQENGNALSQGQRQRLQIARALARNADIFIFDECTSSLDTIREAAVLEAVKALKPGRTTIMITHQIPVMQACDRIVVLKDGRVAEQGTYDSLMARGDVFHALVNGGNLTA